MTEHVDLVKHETDDVEPYVFDAELLDDQDPEPPAARPGRGW